MEKRDRYITIAVAVCLVVFGILVGYLLFGPTHRLEALAGPEEAPAPIYNTAYETGPYETPQGQAFTPRYQYMVTAWDGYLVVLDIGESGVKADAETYRVTDIFVNALPEEEQERLAAGIYIRDEMALFRILEDYGS